MQQHWLFFCELKSIRFSFRNIIRFISYFRFLFLVVLLLKDAGWSDLHIAYVRLWLLMTEVVFLFFFCGDFLSTLYIVSVGNVN